MIEDYDVAVIQLNSQPDLQKNLNQLTVLIDQAAKKGVRLLALPEHAFFLGDFNARLDQAKTIAKKAPKFLGEMAQKHSSYIVGATFPVPAGDSGKVYNRSVVVAPDGSVVAKYDKIHLFDVDLNNGESYRESDFVKPGSPQPVTFFSDDIGSVGLSICYDLRFPELYRALTDDGAEILTVPSAFTQKTGDAHWEVLLRARAIENTCYVLAPAQTGRHGSSRKTHGHSMIIDPWGKIIASADRQPGSITATVQPSVIESTRTAIPCLQHRKL